MAVLQPPGFVLSRTQACAGHGVAEPPARDWGHGVAEPPARDWGTVWPSLLPANASEAQGRSALLPLLWRDAFAHSLALLGGLRVLPWGLHASLQSSPARRALPPSWLMLLEGLWSSDRTGHQINSLSARPDIRAHGHEHFALWAPSLVQDPTCACCWGVIPAELLAHPHDALWD